MLSLRDGMGSGWAGKFFRRRRRRRRPLGGVKIAKTLGFLKKRCENMEKHIYTVKSGFRKLRWGPLDSAERCVLKS